MNRALVCALGALLLVGCKSTDGEVFGIARVVPLPEGRGLLLIEHQAYSGDTSWRNTDYNLTRRRFTLLTAEGQVVKRVTEKITGALTMDDWKVHGVAGEVIWLGQGAGSKRIYARRLTDLETVPGIVEAIEATPMLARGPFVLGTIPSGALVLSGADEKVYLLDPAGKVQPKPGIKCPPSYACKWSDAGVETVVTQPFAPPLGGELAGELAGKRVDVEGLDLLRAEAIGPSFVDPTSVMVRSLDFVGAGNSRVLSRVTVSPDGPYNLRAEQVLWSASVRDLAQPIALKGQVTYDVVWLALRGERLHLLVTARTTDTNPRFVHQLLELDPAAGKPLARHPIGPGT